MTLIMKMWDLLDVKHLMPYLPFLELNDGNNILLGLATPHVQFTNLTNFCRVCQLLVKYILQRHHPALDMHVLENHGSSCRTPHVPI